MDRCECYHCLEWPAPNDYKGWGHRGAVEMHRRHNGKFAAVARQAFLEKLPDRSVYFYGLRQRRTHKCTLKRVGWIPPLPHPADLTVEPRFLVRRFNIDSNERSLGQALREDPVTTMAILQPALECMRNPDTFLRILENPSYEMHPEARCKCIGCRAYRAYLAGSATFEDLWRAWDSLTLKAR